METDEQEEEEASDWGRDGERRTREVSGGVTACWDSRGRMARAYRQGRWGMGWRGGCCEATAPLPDAIIPPACEEVSGLFSPQLRAMNGDVVGRLCLR